MSICESCAYYTYDSVEDYYVCTINLDEDEMYSFIQRTTSRCPYYRNGDEYTLVRKQN